MRRLSLIAPLLLAACLVRPPPGLLTGSAVETERPELKRVVLTQQTNGKQWRLEDDLGSVVLLDVWAT